MTQKMVRYGISLCYGVGMVLIAELIRQPEVIFPEIIALLIGGLLSPRQVWRATGPQLVFYMTLSAVAGLCLSAYVPGPMLSKFALALVFVGALLVLSRTTLAPVISACVLPVLLSTESWIYPLSVFCAALVIVVTRALLEKKGWVAPPERPSGKIPWRRELPAWGKLTLFAVGAAVLPISLGMPYFIAPPLLVTFVEAFHFKPVMRRFTKKLIPFTLCAALLGVSCRMLLSEMLALPLALSALVIAAALFLVIHKTALLFPPVGAIAFLPLILPAAGLWWYPAEVTIGISVFLLLAHRWGSPTPA